MDYSQAYHNGRFFVFSNPPCNMELKEHQYVTTTRYPEKTKYSYHKYMWKCPICDNETFSSTTTGITKKEASIPPLCHHRNEMPDY